MNSDRFSTDTVRRDATVLRLIALIATAAAMAMLSSASSAASNGRSGNPASTDGPRSYAVAQVDCLPRGFKLTDIVSYKGGAKGDRNVTIKDKLTELKGHCRQGKLVDAKGREIRFFRFSCFGNPPENYEEIVQKERAEFENLQKDYTVVVLKCDPRVS